MEDRERAFAEEPVPPPFSELISRWLDEGERLSEAMSTSRVATASLAETPVRQAFLRLRAGIERHRLAVLVCVGLLPFVLFLATHQSAERGAPLPVVSPSASSLAPITTSPAPAPPPAAGHGLAVGAPKAPPAAHRAVVTVRRAPPAAHRAVVAVRKSPPAARKALVGVRKAPGRRPGQ